MAIEDRIEGGVARLRMQAPGGAGFEEGRDIVLVWDPAGLIRMRVGGWWWRWLRGFGDEGCGGPPGSSSSIPRLYAVDRGGDCGGRGYVSSRGQ